MFACHKFAPMYCSLQLGARRITSMQQHLDAHLESQDVRRLTGPHIVTKDALHLSCLYHHAQRRSFAMNTQQVDWRLLLSSCYLQCNASGQLVKRFELIEKVHAAIHYLLEAKALAANTAVLDVARSIG